MKNFFTPLLFFFFSFPSMAQEMTVFLGLTGYQYYEDSRPLITDEVHSLLSENKLAFDHWKRSRIYNTIAFTSGAVALGTAIGIVVREKDNPAPTGLYVASIGTTIIGLVMTLSANNKKKKAVLNYNNGLDKKIGRKVKPIVNQEGIGLTLRF